MKIINQRKNSIFLFFVLMLAFVACSDDKDEFQDFLNPTSSSETVFNQGFNFTDAAFAQSISFEAGQKWTATLSEENTSSNWCQVSPSEGSAGNATIVVTVVKNETGAARTAQLVIASGSKRKEISITQSANAITIPDGLSYTPAEPDADQPVTITFKADAKSELYGYKGDVYLHTGVVSAGTWLFVPADWAVNIDKCKMISSEANIWSITLSPGIREWFNSGETPVNQLGIVIRSSDGTKKGLKGDSFIAVTDTKYEGFKPGEVKMAALPNGVVEGINMIDNSTVTLVLYDKDKNGSRKDYAYVMGDFNDWTLSNTDKSQMNRDDAAGCWWITLSGLDASREYAFQYYVGTAADGAIRLADAYCEKILDPDNDKYIKSSTYPENERVYPEGGIGIVSIFKIQKENFAWSSYQVENPDNLIIYEMHFRDFTASQDINGAMDKLDYLKKLGVNAIELMPVQEFDGNDSWGYNPCFFFAMDKAYGTKAMYKNFIDACHKKGIAVILDVVYNHATGNHPFAKLYWDSSNNKTAVNNPWFNVDAPHPYSVFHDFNHESTLVRDFVKRNLKFLLEEYNIDGFRFDLTKGFTQNSSDEGSAGNYDASRIAILKDYNQAIIEVKQNAVVILEHFCEDREEKELAEAGMHVWRNANNAYCQSGMGWQDDSAFSSLYTGTNNMTFGAYVGFMESHDEERVGFKMKEYGNGDIKTNINSFMNSLTSNATFFFTVPGPKMIWQFGEMGYDVSIEENGRTGKKPLHWEYETERANLVTNYTKLIKLRNENSDLFAENASFTWEVTKDNWDTGRFILASTATKNMVVVGNFTPNEHEYTVSFPVNGTWNNYLTGDKIQVSGGEHKVVVPAHCSLVFTTF